jgi:toxin HigB-1
MIVSFRDVGTHDIHVGQDTRAARRTCPRLLWPAARKRLDRIQIAERLVDLRLPPGNRFEALQGGRLGTFSIRINDQYRICFRWIGRDAEEVEIVDYH